MKNMLRLKNKSNIPTLPKVEDIPVLIPQKALDAIKAGASAENPPYEFIEAIEYPTEGTGGTYTADYFQSILEYLKQHPIPGSKDGHESQAVDFYTIGGNMQARGEADGVCCLRIIVPRNGWSSSNEQLIAALKAGVPELSIVADVEPTRGNDGKVYFTKELGRPRNDIVPEGAMDVTIGNDADEKEIMRLIEAGKIDFEGESDTLVHNGKVSRRAAVRLQFNSDKKALAGRVLNAIAERSKSKKIIKNREEKNGMTKEEIIEAVKTAIANNALTLEELASAVGLENKLRNATDEQKAKLVTAIAEALELPPETPTAELLKAVEDALKEAEEAAETTVEAEAAELSNGKKLKNADGTEVDNPVFLYAKNALKGLRGKQLNAKKEALKVDPIMVALRSKQADTLTGVLSGGRVYQQSVIREV